MKEYKVDKNKINYTQRNNLILLKNGKSVFDKNCTCGPTSMCQALDYNGFHFPQIIEYEQPEDELAHFINTNKEILEIYEKDYPAMYRDFKGGKKDCYWPTEIHRLLAHGTNLWLETDAVSFSENNDFKKLLYEEIVKKESAFVVSGSFPKSDGKRLNHIVTITGVIYHEAHLDEAFKNKEYPTPTYIIWDDPYGNTLKDFTGSGNDVKVDWSYAIQNLKPLNSRKKWAHTFTKPVEVI